MWKLLELFLNRFISGGRCRIKVRYHVNSGDHINVNQFGNSNHSGSFRQEGWYFDADKVT